MAQPKRKTLPHTTAEVYTGIRNREQLRLAKVATSDVANPKANRGKREVIANKPVGVVFDTIPFRAPKVDYAELFAASTALSLGANISVIRSWMELEGLPELPERISAVDFANVSARFMLPRHAWPFFEKAERHKAVKFIADQANRLSPEILKDREPNQRQPLASWMVPALGHLYNPALLKRKTI